MKIIGRLVMGLALGVAALSSTDAAAATICSGCSYEGTSQYLGVHNPITEDQSTYVHDAIVADFTDTWVFDINPAGTANLTAVFNPTNGVDDFSVTLYDVLASVGCGATNTACTSVTTGGAIASNTPGTHSLAIQNQALLAGRYAFVISGVRVNQQGAESYSGNLNVFQTVVPEPASLALLGLGLAGVAALRRRRSA